jgi:hypothetical protein
MAAARVYRQNWQSRRVVVEVVSYFNSIVKKGSYNYYEKVVTK